MAAAISSALLLKIGAEESARMNTAYDWITVAIFAWLVTRFLAQSMTDEPSDSLWHYLLPAAGCATANWLGNEGWHIPAVALIAVILGYIYYLLRHASPPEP
jgi:ABC-type sugar transport system permease subunit